MTKSVDILFDEISSERESVSRPAQIEFCKAIEPLVRTYIQDIRLADPPDDPGLIVEREILFGFSKKVFCRQNPDGLHHIFEASSKLLRERLTGNILCGFVVLPGDYDVRNVNFRFHYMVLRN